MNVKTNSTEISKILFRKSRGTYAITHTHTHTHTRGFPGGSVIKNPPANSGDMWLIPWSGRSPGEGNGNPLQYSCLGNPMDRGA